MTDTSMHHQLTGATWLQHCTRGYLGDEPGLGKTRTALLAASQIDPRLRVTVVCPAIVVPHWYRESLKLGLELDLTVRSYERATAVPPPPGDLLIFDEAHYLKHIETARYSALLDPLAGAARRFRRVWMLSGTPMPRNPLELFAPMTSLWPRTLEAFGVETQQKFLDEFCHYRVTKYGPKVLRAKNTAKLKIMLKEFMLRRLTSEVAPDLPPLRWGVLTLDGKIDAETEVLESLLQPDTIRMIYNGDVELLMDDNLARYYHKIGDAKAGPVASMLLDEIDADSERKIVVFAYHHSVMDQIENNLMGKRVARIDGLTSMVDREAELKLFQTDPQCQIFLGQINACATGLDGLQTASHDVVLVEPVWGSNVNVQAAHRVARIGQKMPALARMISLAGTLDDAIVRNHYREVQMVREITG